MILSFIVFGLLALVTIFSALAVITSRNAVYSALFLVLNLATVAIFYLILGAPFISLVQVTVYAGSIMVLFLFVIMLLGAERFFANEPIKKQRFIGILLAVVLMAEVGLFIFWRLNVKGLTDTGTATLVSPSQIGMALFTDYSLPFLITSIILVVAVIGAIIFTRSGGQNGKDLEQQGN